MIKAGPVTLKTFQRHLSDYERGSNLPFLDLEGPFDFMTYRNFVIYNPPLYRHRRRTGGERGKFTWLSFSGDGSPPPPEDLAILTI